MSEVLAALQSLFTSMAEFDEIYAEPLPDGRLKVVGLVTAITPKLAKWKVFSWALSGLPSQVIEEVTIQELQGYYLKRYRVEVILTPLLRARRLKLKDLLFDKNVRIVERPW